MKRFFMAILTCGMTCANAKAAWVVEKNLYSLSGNNTPDIRKVLGMTNDSGIGMLTRENLTSSKPLKVTSAAVDASFYRWENDKDCTVPDLTKVKKLFVQHFQATYDYFLEDGAPESHLIMQLPVFHAPCGLPPGESAVTYQVK
jgi:hypothetical protein